MENSQIGLSIFLIVLLATNGLLVYFIYNQSLEKKEMETKIAYSNPEELSNCQIQLKICGNETSKLEGDTIDLKNEKIQEATEKKNCEGQLTACEDLKQEYDYQYSRCREIVSAYFNAEKNQSMAIDEFIKNIFG